MRKTLGQIGYEAFVRSASGVTVLGKDMPTWDQIRISEGSASPILMAWEVAAGAVARFAINGVAVRESLRSVNQREKQLFANGHDSGLDRALDAVFREILNAGGRGVDSLEALAIDYDMVDELRLKLNLKATATATKTSSDMAS